MGSCCILYPLGFHPFSTLFIITSINVFAEHVSQSHPAREEIDWKSFQNLFSTEKNSIEEYSENYSAQRRILLKNIPKSIQRREEFCWRIFWKLFGAEKNSIEEYSKNYSAQRKIPRKSLPKSPRTKSKKRNHWDANPKNQYAFWDYDPKSRAEFWD